MVKRTPVRISTQTVSLTKPTGLGKKAEGAWRYPGGVILRHDKRMINNGYNEEKEYWDDKDPSQNRRKHESNFFITLNTNRTLKGVDPMVAANGRTAMKETLEKLADDKEICAYMKFGPKSNMYKDDRYHDVIQKIEWTAAVEEGEILGNLHCHIWMTVHHYSQVQINYQVLQHMFKKEYNARVNDHSALKVSKNPYVQVKLLPTSDWAMVMKQYMQKAMTAPA